MPPTKIATCCYCGTRAALVLRGAQRHELSCASCGAPLHDMKMLRADHGGTRELVRPSPVRRSSAPKYDRPERKKPKKRRKGFAEWLIEEAWDTIEDIFD